MTDHGYTLLAVALARMRQKHGFSLTAWVFLPDHWHAILYPPYPLGIAKAMSAMKVSSICPEYAGVKATEQERRCGLAIARVPLPTDPNARI